MEPELEVMLKDERETVLLHSGHLRALNPDMKSDYERELNEKAWWGFAAVCALCAFPFILMLLGHLRGLP